VTGKQPLMGKEAIYGLLEQPWIYRLAQSLCAPGAQTALAGRIDQIIKELPAASSILDIGCGPSSWLWRSQLHPVGLDLSFNYSSAFSRCGDSVVTASAAALPFLDTCFDGVWCIGLLHHLPDADACSTVKEMMRVCRVGGYVAILDAVMPKRPWRRPIAYGLRRFDRGEFVRSQEHLLSLLPSIASWRVERFTYALTGLEIVGCYFVCQRSRLNPAGQRSTRKDLPPTLSLW
jgi:SAM-dependent methyltransferase